MIKKTLNSHRNRRVQYVAIVIVSVCYLFAREPAISHSERQKLASGFAFSPKEIDIDRFSISGLKYAREVHPRLSRISAWVLGTRSAATVGDLDGDGIENDLLLVDTRIDRLVALPIPGTEKRQGTAFEAFPFDVDSLPFDPTTMSPSGSLIGDFNEDGLPDVLSYFWGRTPVLFLRTESSPNSSILSASSYTAIELTPELVGTKAGQWFTHTAIQADFNGDSHLDLMVGNFYQDGADVLNPNGTGDAAVIHQGKSRAKNGGGAKLFLWRNSKGGANPTAEFVNKTLVLEALCGTGWVLAAGAADLDRDGLPELYIAHDFGPDRLLHNRSTPGNLAFAVCEGRRSFTTPRSFVLGQDSFKGMGVGFGDVNRDGFMDIFVSNIADDWALHESHFLWLSTGQIEDFQHGIAPYDQKSEELGLSRSGWGWDSVLVDLNNDGQVEAIQATGFAKGKVTPETKLSPIDRGLFSLGFLQHGINRWPELQAVGTTNDQLIHHPRAWPKMEMPTATLSGYDSNPIYVRCDSGRFVDVSDEVGLGEFYNTRGIAIADVDADGLQDFVYGNQWEPSVFVRNNSQKTNRFLALSLLMPTSGQAAFSVDPDTPVSGRPAIGAVAEVLTDLSHFFGPSTKLVGQVDGGSGHSGHGTKEIHFGLGSFDQGSIRVLVSWRGSNGKPNEAEVSLKPGRHTIVLGNTEARADQ